MTEISGAMPNQNTSKELRSTNQNTRTDTLMLNVNVNVNACALPSRYLDMQPEAAGLG